MPPAVAGSRPRGAGRGKVNPAGTGMMNPAGRTGQRQRVNPPGTGMMNPPGQGSAGGQGQRGKPRGQGAGGNGTAIGGQALPGPGGRQLQARVASGAITGEQAQRTMQQRQTLAKALGPDWRNKLQVGGKSFAQVNKQLKANPGNARLAALRKRLVENRSAVLANARKKGGGEEGGA